MKSKTENLAPFILRVFGGGIMLIAHGWPKLIGFSQKSAFFPDPIGLGSNVALALAVFAEVFCAFALVIGLLTRLATLPLITTMAVAAFVIHAADPFAKKEMAIIYLVIFTALLFSGPGKYSIDHFVFKRR